MRYRAKGTREHTGWQSLFYGAVWTALPIRMAKSRSASFPRSNRRRHR